MINWLDMLRVFALCTAATVFYSLLLKTPKKAILIASVVGSLGYIIYLLLSERAGDIVAYFAGTLFIAITGEILARVMKMPSTVFIIPGIIPLVPGYGLYRTMLLMTLNEFDSSIRTGAATFLAAGAMAVAIALTNFIARSFFPKKR